MSVVHASRTHHFGVGALNRVGKNWVYQMHCIFVKGIEGYFHEAPTNVESYGVRDAHLIALDTKKYLCKYISHVVVRND